MKKLICIISIISVVGVATSQLRSENVTLAWDQNPTPPPSSQPVTGYMLYMGLTTGNYTTVTDVGNVTQKVVTTLSPGESYFFNIRAYNAVAMQSPYALELRYDVPTIIGFITDCITTAGKSTSRRLRAAKTAQAGIVVKLTGNQQNKQTTTDANGKYTFFVPLPTTSYIITPQSPTPLPPAHSSINTMDVITINKIFLGLSPTPIDCPKAPDVNEDNSINTLDVIATNQFFLGQQLAHVGQYRFQAQANFNFKIFALGDVVPNP